MSNNGHTFNNLNIDMSSFPQLARISAPQSAPPIQQIPDFSLPPHIKEKCKKIIEEYQEMIDDYKTMRENYLPHVRHTLILEGLLSQFNKKHEWLISDNYDDIDFSPYEIMVIKIIKDMFGSDIINECKDMVTTEIKDLINFINSKKELEDKIDNMEKKLDSILMGPDYEQGRQIMNEAEEEFNSHL